MKEMMKAVAYGRKEKGNFWVNVRVLFLYLLPLRAEASRCPYICTVADDTPLQDLRCWCSLHELASREATKIIGNPL